MVAIEKTSLFIYTYNKPDKEVSALAGHSSLIYGGESSLDIPVWMWRDETKYSSLLFSMNMIRLLDEI